jgi:hypothetical protein
LLPVAVFVEDFFRFVLAAFRLANGAALLSPKLLILLAIKPPSCFCCCWLRGGHQRFLPFTRLSLGLAVFAFALARRDDAARIAPARFLETPSFAAIWFWTDLKPGWAFFFAMMVLL